MKKIVLFLCILSFGNSAFCQLKNQEILLEIESFDKNDKTKNLIAKISSENEASDPKTRSLLSGTIPYDALTNIVVNTVKSVIKKRINRKNVSYSASASGDEFYFIENDSDIFQGLKSINLKRKKDDKIKLKLQIIPVFSIDKRFFKWRIANCEIKNGAFKKNNESNVDLKLTIDFTFHYIDNQSKNAKSVNSTQQIINIYAAQKFDSSRIIESKWMNIPELSLINNKIFSPVFDFKLTTEEITSIPEIYKEVLKEENELTKSLTDFIKKLTNQKDSTDRSK